MCVLAKGVNNLVWRQFSKPNRHFGLGILQNKQYCWCGLVQFDGFIPVFGLNSDHHNINETLASSNINKRIRREVVASCKHKIGSIEKWVVPT